MTQPTVSKHWRN